MVGATVVFTAGLSTVALVGGGSMIVASTTATAAAGIAYSAGTVALTGVAMYATANVFEDDLIFSRGRTGKYFPTGIYRAEHVKNARNSTKDKHEKGQTAKNRDHRGEKGDARRRRNRNSPKQKR
jgi:formylmethanofuran dehydrogenase subunit C